MISAHYKNEFDARGQLFNRFLNYLQFAVSLSFFVLSVKSLFVENWDFFLLNSGLMILASIAALRGLTSFKLKDYTQMRAQFFQSEGLQEDDTDLAHELPADPGRLGPRLLDISPGNVQMQRSVVRKFHSLYSDSVVKEVISRSKLRFQNRLEEAALQKTFASEALSARSKKSLGVRGDQRPTDGTRAEDSLAQIIADRNLNKLSKHYMNTCGLDISYGSVGTFEDHRVETRKLIRDTVGIDKD